MIPIRPTGVASKPFSFAKHCEMTSSFVSQLNKTVTLRFPCEKYRVTSINIYRVPFAVKESLPNTTAATITRLILFLTSFFLG